MNGVGGLVNGTIDNKKSHVLQHNANANGGITFAKASGQPYMIMRSDGSGIQIAERLYVDPSTTSGMVFSSVSWSDLGNEKMITMASAYSDLKPRGGIAISRTGKVYAWNGQANQRKEISNW